jgi:hypothetical protein
MRLPAPDFFEFSDLPIVGRNEMAMKLSAMV